jgi:uncharacterized caspase-like protein
MSAACKPPVPGGRNAPVPTRRRLLAQVAAMAALAAAPAAAVASPAGARVALVIGNGDYRHVPRLANPTHDARLMAATLGGLGFTLVGGGARLDLDRAQFAQALAAFGRRIRGADVALFYYSGHGMQVDGTNWLVPVSADPTRLADLPAQMVSADSVLRQAEGAGTRLNIVILDACRDNPFALHDAAPAPATPILRVASPEPGPAPAARGMDGAGGGLAVMQAPPGTLISYATQPGNVALDGTGGNSPFTAALAAVMRQPGISLFRMFNNVGLLVERATQGMQQPWISTSPILGDFYFASPGSAAPAGAGAAGPVVPPGARRFDGRYEGTAPGTGIYGCPRVALSITVAGTTVSGKAIKIKGRDSFFEQGLFTSAVSGHIEPDGYSVLVLRRASARAPGAPLRGRFVAGRFEGQMGGKAGTCLRTVTLYRQ